MAPRPSSWAVADGKFSAGFDLSVMTAGPSQARELLGRGAELGIRLFEFPVPVVFAVTGHALAMGGILLCCADVRIGADGPFKIGLPEVRIGMPVPAFAVELCRSRLTSRWFTRSIQLAEGLNPMQALDAGYLDEVVDPEAVRARADEVARELAEAVHPGPFRMTRSTIRGQLAGQLREHSRTTWRASASSKPDPAEVLARGHPARSLGDQATGQ